MQKKLIIIISLSLILAACSTTPSFRPTGTGKDIQSSETNSDSAISYRKPRSKSAITDSGLDANADNDAYSDVWRRIRDKLSLQRHVDNKGVKEKIAWYARNQEYLNRVAERATPYIYYIVEEIEKRDMPLELALLPIVESAYHPFAYSRSHASGLWQFIPGTGKIFGLKQNWWYDGRRDVVAATRAALDYLQKLHNQFGDWELAVAAYNTGERNIERAIAKNSSASKKTDFFSLTVHKETRGYVPSLLAVAEIVAEPEKYGIELMPIPNKPYFTQVDIGGQLDLSTVASLTGMNMDEIYTLNPGFSRWATDPDGPHYLLLPLDKEQMFLAGLAAIPQDQRVTWNQHVIKQGETLSHIADAYKTSVAMLKETNNLKSNLIRAGQTLMIPGSKTQGKFTSPALANQQRVTGQQPVGVKQVYTVRAGDNPWAISKRFGVNLKELLAWNGLNANTILRPGQKLNLWNEAAAPAKPQLASAKETINTIADNKDYSKNEHGHIQYTVKKGDTLWLISRKFGVTVAQLQQWNKLSNRKPLQPGQTLLLMDAPRLAAGA
jgi:membrane-bound lytic murein transglycosylase D